MKKLLLAGLVVVAALVGYNFVTTGELSVVPVARTAEERDLAALERRVGELRRELGQAHRAAGLTGTDTTGDVGAVVVELRQISEELAGLRKKLTSDTARRDAERLGAEIRGLLEQLR